jgi:plastocyanin
MDGFISSPTFLQIRQLTLQRCQNLCAEDSKCKSFHFKDRVLTPGAEAQSICALKTITPKSDNIKDPNTFRWAKGYQLYIKNTECATCQPCKPVMAGFNKVAGAVDGKSLLNNEGIKESAVDCANSCANNPGCKSFQFRSDKQCLLYSEFVNNREVTINQSGEGFFWNFTSETENVVGAARLENGYQALTVYENDNVTFTGKPGMLHQFAIKDSNDKDQLGPTIRGSDFTLTLRLTAGEYIYYCPPHAGFMFGKLTVLPGSADSNLYNRRECGVCSPPPTTTRQTDRQTLQDFTDEVTGFIQGGALKNIRGASLAQCKQACVDNSDCKAFHFKAETTSECGLKTRIADTNTLKRDKPWQIKYKAYNKITN